MEPQQALEIPFTQPHRVRRFHVSEDCNFEQFAVGDVDGLKIG